MFAWESILPALLEGLAFDTTGNSSKKLPALVLTGGLVTAGLGEKAIGLFVEGDGAGPEALADCG
jgi:hypothetical protein